MKSILDRSFLYTPSFQTDLKATFARVRREEATAASGPRGEAVPSAPPAAPVAGKPKPSE